MMILRDDQVIEVFDSPDRPPNWIEAIDVQNEEYRFCDDAGQRYVGEIIRPGKWFRQATWRLRREGEPDIKNAIDLINQAKLIEPNDRLPDLEALKQYITSKSKLPRVPLGT